MPSIPQCSSCFKPYSAVRLQGIDYYSCGMCGSTLIDLQSLKEKLPDFFPAEKKFKTVESNHKRCPICLGDSQKVIIRKDVGAYLCSCGKLHFEKDPLEGWFDEIENPPEDSSFAIEFSDILFWAVILGFFCLLNYLSESLYQAFMSTVFFVLPLVWIIAKILESGEPFPYDPDEENLPVMLKFGHFLFDVTKSLIRHWFRVLFWCSIAVCVWIATRPLRAQILKDISIMIQPEDRSKEAHENPNYFKRLALMCDFAVDAYRTDPKVLADWEIRSIRNVCEISGDTKRYLKAIKYLPEIPDEDEAESYDIKGSAVHQPVTAK